MPFYQTPESDEARLRYMERAILTATSADPSRISAETLGTLRDVCGRFKPALSALTLHLGTRAREVGEKEEALGELELYTRDFVEGLGRAVRRLRLPVATFNLYGLPQSGTLPNTSARDEWLARAAALVEGDARAVAAGYPPMSNPSAAELQGKLEAARREANQIAPANEAVAAARQGVTKLRLEVDAVIQETVDEIAFATRRLAPPAQRQVLRDYGARFRYYEGEPRDEGDLAESAEQAAGESEG